MIVPLTVDNVLEISDPKSLLDLRPEHFTPRLLTEAEFAHIFGLLNAFWIYQGDVQNPDPNLPHAELTSGKCSTGYINCSKGLALTNLCSIFAGQLTTKLAQQHGKLPIDWVVASDHAGAAFGKDVANLLDTKYEFCEKGADKSQIWKRQVIEPGETVLQVEELITTLSTITAVRQGIRLGNPHPVEFTPVSLVLVNRSHDRELSLEAKPVIHLFYFDIQAYDGPDVCPLCQAGSPRYKPKGKDWELLTGKA